MSLPLARKDFNRKALKLKIGLHRALGYWRVSQLKNAEFRQLPVYCISLADKTQRRDMIARQVEVLGLARFQFVDAVNAKEIDIAALIDDGVYDEAAAVRYHGRPLRPEEVACSLSHGKAYERILAEQHPRALVIEDDALFVPHRIDQLRLSDLPQDFEIVFLNSFRTQEPPEGPVEGNIYRDTSYDGSTAAYILTRAAAEKLSRAYKPIIHAADGLVGRSLKLCDGQEHEFRQQGVTIELTSYLCYPDCIHNGSDLNFTPTVVW